MSGDERWTTYEPQGPSGEVPTPRPRRTPKPATKPRKPTSKWSTPPGRRSGTRPVVVALVVAVPLLVVGAIVVAIVVEASGIGKPDAHSAEGLAELRADIEDRTGGTEVFQAVIYPDYAVVDVPVDATSQREDSLYWDGDLSEFGGKGTTDYTRLDLADVDAAVMVAAIGTAKTLVEEPTSWYVIVDGPTVGQDDGRPTITAYASNEYGESGRVEVALDGTELDRDAPG